MKKALLAAAVVGILGYVWVAAHDGAYDANAKYIGNLNSYKFHRITCRYVKKMTESNKYYALDKAKLIKKGMKPCGYCRPK